MSFDFISGLASFAGDAFSGVGSFLDNSMISDAVNGALFGAVAAKIGGGDMLEGAAWGAAGNAIRGPGDDGIFGTWSNEIGAAIGGYGIDKAMGGDGLLGAGLGVAGDYLTGQYGEMPGGADGAPGDSLRADLGADPDPGTAYTDSLGRSPSALQQFGLVNGAGEGTLLGKGLLGAAGMYGKQLMAEDLKGSQGEEKRDDREHQAELNERTQQRNLRAFRTGSPLVVRNG